MTATLRRGPVRTVAAPAAGPAAADPAVANSNDPLAPRVAAGAADLAEGGVARAPRRRDAAAGRAGGRERPAATTATRAARGRFVVLVAAVVVGALTCLLMLNTVSAADEVQEQSIADANAVSAAQVQQLQVDLAARRAPAALARAATALGMVPATNPAFLRIGSDGSVSLLGVGAPVAAPPIALTAPAAGTGTGALIPGAPGTTGTGPATPATPVGAAPAAGAPAPTATPASTAPPAPTAPAAATPPGAPAAPTTTVTLPGGAR